MINFIDISGSAGSFGKRLQAFCKLPRSSFFRWQGLCSLQLFSFQGVLLHVSVFFLFSPPDSSFSKCITKVLDVRKQEFEELERQKKQRCSFICLCHCIEDIIKGTGWVNGASSALLEWGNVS